MPIAGKGMLLTSMDIDAADEAEFNRWYDREHLEERVAIDGFLEARRYVAEEGSMPKYLSLYSTQTFQVLDSPAYRAALANQTNWSKANIGRFKNMIRSVARITISRGKGRGAWLGVLLRPVPGKEDELRVRLRDALDPQGLDGIISMHLLESDPQLSRPLTENASTSDAGASDWFWLIDHTDANPTKFLFPRIKKCEPLIGAMVSTGSYRLLWDIAKTDIS